MEKFFKIKERGSSVGTEVLGGLTTFLAMAYIAAVNPAILTAAGVPFAAALCATCLGAALVTILMGLIANRPFALASGMGLNAMVAFSICLGSNVDWRVAMAVVFLEGVVILILVLCGLRKAVMEAIPADLRQAIGVGIGLFLAFVGLQGGGIIASSESTLVTLGDLSSPTCIVALVSIVVAVVLHLLKVKGSLIISIIVAVIVGIPLGVTTLPTDWSFGLDFSTFFAPLQKDPETGLVAICTPFLKPALLLLAFSLLMSDFFDTMGAVIIMDRQIGLSEGDDDSKDVQRVLMADSLGAIIGGLFGCSSITTYIESATGIASGARTGLANIVCGLLFIVCAFLSPLFGMVSSAATCGALVMVGFLMASELGHIKWDNPATAFPAFLIIIGMPLGYSITTGIGLGFIAYCVIMVATGKIRDVKLLMWISSLAFLINFILG